MTKTQRIAKQAESNFEISFYLSKARKAKRSGEHSKARAYARKAYSLTLLAEAEQARKQAARRTREEINATSERLLADITRRGEVELRELEGYGRHLSSDLAALVRQGRVTKQVRETYDAVTNRYAFGGTVACKRRRAIYRAA